MHASVGLANNTWSCLLRYMHRIRQLVANIVSGAGIRVSVTLKKRAL